MVEQSFNTEVPFNIKELKKKSSNKTSWRDRLDSVNELKRYDCRQSRDIIKILALHDPVYKVAEAAFEAAQAYGLTKKGKPLYLRKKKKGNLDEGIPEMLKAVSDSFKGEPPVQEFKEKFKAMYPKTFDTYDGEMGASLDEWLKDQGGLIHDLDKT
ncbi:MAG TPA: HEAT repeat domain-containing protein [Desulfosporosinus sp.]